MKLITVVVYALRMCMKEDNPCPKYVKEDHSRETISCAGLTVLMLYNLRSKSELFGCSACLHVFK